MPNVTIRMYKQGLGDCFLLSFPRQDGATNFYMLIDCGAITGTDPANVVAAAQDVYTTTNGHLDLVVGTHEHWDHLSGFHQARDIFDKCSIDTIWLGWTEDPSDPTAQSLVKDRSARLAALQTALTRMTAADDSRLKRSIYQVLSFFGIDPDQPFSGAGDGLAAAGAAGTTQEAMQYLRTRKDASVHYCNPVKDPPHPLEGVDGVRAYVFGPPVDLKLLKQSDPSKTGQQTYGLVGMNADDSFFAAISAPGDDSRYSLLRPLVYPFDPYYWISPEEAQDPDGDDFFLKSYGFNEDDADAWRRIDTDWLDVTSELALNLDSDTNNTSLVLALELGEAGSGKVLLFAADAQVGNWLSWGNLSWTVNGSSQQPAKTVQANDLLSRVVFYKVGHHGSHNATLSKQGLELMVSEDMVAMIPVVHDMAVKKGWVGMPFPALYTRLQQKTRGRVMRIDTGLPQRQDAAALTDAEWNNFISHTRETPLFIEYTIQY